MQEYQSISRVDIESRLTGDLLKVSQIISLALTLVPALFLLMIVLNSSQPADLNNVVPDLSSVSAFFYMLFLLAAIIYPIFHFLPKFLLKPDKLRKNLTELRYDRSIQKENDPVKGLILYDRQFMIIRLALLQSVSLFAMGILFITASDGSLSFYPSLWLLVLPLAFQAYFTYTNYIPREKYIERIEKDYLPLLQQPSA